jgi:hypothetical protein
MAAERVLMLEEATRRARPWVLSGAIIGWGDALTPTFDLVVFLYVPAGVRLARLGAREQERFGPEVEPGGLMYEQHQAFLQSALAMTRVPAREHSRPTQAGWHSSVAPCFP